MDGSANMAGQNMNDQPQVSALTREKILAALQALSDELSKRGVMGEICLFGGTVLYHANSIPVKTLYLVESLFEEGKI